MSSAMNPSSRPRKEGDTSLPEVTEPSTRAAGQDSRAVVAEQRNRFGGMKFGACFFGWLTATGTAVLLTALLTAIGAGVGLGRDLSAGQPPMDAQTVGLVGGIVILVIVFVAYLAGGYVAGRMARFNGIKQGVGVWLWAVVVAVVVAVLSAVAGARFNLLGSLNGFPRIPVNEGTLTTSGIVIACAVAVSALLGALLGGVIGMRFHRRVD